MPEATEHTSISILFWNLHKNDETYPLIGQMVEEYGVDVCVFAEAPDAADFLLNRYLPRGFNFFPSSSDKLKVKYFHSSRIIMKVAGEEVANRGSMLRLTVDNKIDFNLVGCHLPDGRNYTDDQQLEFAILFNQFISNLEDKLHSQRTVVVGDFNMNPFHRGMIAPSAFNSVMCKEVAKRESCVAFARGNRFFYNPMWYFFGHPELMNGTINGTPYYWNLYDQILIRPELIDGFSHDNIEIITRVKDTSLLTPQGHINDSTSDHLPIITTLNL